MSRAVCEIVYPQNSYCCSWSTYNPSTNHNPHTTQQTIMIHVQVCQIHTKISYYKCMYANLIFNVLIILHRVSKLVLAVCCVGYDGHALLFVQIRGDGWAELWAECNANIGGTISWDLFAIVALRWYCSSTSHLLRFRAEDFQFSFGFTFRAKSREIRLISQSVTFFPLQKSNLRLRMILARFGFASHTFRVASTLYRVQCWPQIEIVHRRVRRRRRLKF